MLAPANCHAVAHIVVPHADMVVGRHKIVALGIHSQPVELLAAPLQNADGLAIEGVPVADLPIRPCRTPHLAFAMLPDKPD